MPTVIAEAGRLAVNHPSLSLLLAALAVFLFATNPVEVFWPTYAKPMLNPDYANAAIGTLTAGYFFSIALGASLSSGISRIFKRRHAVTLAAIFSCLAAVQFALTVQSEISGFIIVFVVFSILLGASETPASSLLHKSVGDHQRSTMLSLRSLVQQLGAALGLIVLGAVAEFYTTAVAWGLGAGFLIMAMVLASLLALRLGAAQD